MSLLTTHFCLILTGLQATIARIAAPDRSRTAFLVFVWGRIGRTRQRFERLYARWKSGTLPKPRAPRPPRTGKPRRPPAFRLPQGRAWLLRQLQHYEANGRASQLRHLIANTPELREFLTAAPQAGRLLRPLCQMLGVSLEKPNGVPLPPLPPQPAPEHAPAPAGPNQAVECDAPPIAPPSPPEPNAFFSSA